MQPFQFIEACHYCSSRDSFNNKLVPRCSKKICNKIFCLDCIKKHLDKAFSQTKYNKDTWICYSCQNKCTCANCKSFDKNSEFVIKCDLDESSEEQEKQQVIIKNQEQKQKKQQAQSKKVQFSLPPNFSDATFPDNTKSHEVMYINIQSSEQYYQPKSLTRINNTKSQSQQLPNFKAKSNFFQTDLYRDDSQTPLEYSSEMHISVNNDKKTQKITKKKTERALVGLKIDKVPPYLQAIIKRREIFKNYMQKHSGKSYEQLYKQSLERHSGGQHNLPIIKQSVFIKPVHVQSPHYHHSHHPHQQYHHHQPYINHNNHQKQIISRNPAQLPQQRQPSPTPSLSYLPLNNSLPYIQQPSAQPYTSMPSPIMRPQIPSNQLFLSPQQPQTPSFLPNPEPMTPIASSLKLSQMLNQQLRQYDMDDDDLSIELL